MILKTLNTLFEPGDVVELRVLSKNKYKNKIGYFKDFEKLALKAAKLDSNDNANHNTYVTLNRCKPGIFARCPDELNSSSEISSATSANDIESRRWLLVDCDPDIPSGIPSNDEEHEACIEMAKRIRTDLMGLGWPDPVVADSGNGAHLLWRIDLPNDSDSLQLVTNILKALDRFYTEKDSVKIDIKNVDASRICKLHGTKVRKGFDTPEAGRPWRMSGLLHVPDEQFIVSREQLQSYADLYTCMQVPGPKKSFGPKDYRSGIEVKEWLERHHIEIAKEKEDSNGTKTYVLSTCPWDPSHTDNSAYVMQFASGAIVAKCHHNGCSGKEWIDLKKMFDNEPSAPRRDEIVRVSMQERSSTNTEFDVDSITTSLTNDADVDRLFAIHGHDLKYCREQKEWAKWNGRIWEISETVITEATRDMISLIRAQAVRQGTDKQRDLFLAYANKKESSTYKFFDTANLAAKDSRFHTSLSDFDVDPYLLNFENGVLNLKTFEFTKQETEMMLSKSVGYDYDPDARCDLFIKFLHEIFEDDEELILYIQRLMGYCLLGEIIEKCFTVFYGADGDNGKTVLLDILRAYVGSYAANARVETFLHDDHSKVGDDLAVLAGKRVITASEPEENARFAIGLLKRWSGREPITCRFLYGTDFTYVPQGHIVIAANNRPKIYEHTDAAWERVHIVPFNVKIPKNRQDKGLTKKLKAELPGIMNWAIRGLMNYYELGDLKSTDSMIQMTKDYRKNNDSVLQFFEECCEIDVDEKIVNTKIISRYKKYCSENGINPLGAKKFGEAFENIGKSSGFGCCYRDRYRIWTGIKLIMTNEYL